MTTDPIDPSRRRFLRDAGFGLAVALAGTSAASPRAGARTGSDPDLWLRMTAMPDNAAIHPGAETRVWTYAGRVLRGDRASVSPAPGPGIGPTLRVRRGQRLRVDFENRIDEASIINWHGLHVPARMQGLPRYAAQPGARYRYEFTVNDRAGMYWYHAMSAGHTPEQVYFGLSGLLLVDDPADAPPTLPFGAHDLPIVIQDRDFGSGNQLSYPLGSGPNRAEPDAGTAASPTQRRGMMGGRMMGGGMMIGHGPMPNDMADMMTRVMGFFGSTILVNGHPDAVFDLAAGACRLRILNASNSRIYRLAWSDGRPLVVIATGGGLLEAPTSHPCVMLAPGQRIGLWADFSTAAVGTEYTMLSLPFSGTMGMMGGRMAGTMGMVGRGMRGAMGERSERSALAPGARFPLFRVRVARKPDGSSAALPRRLSALTRLRAEDAVNAARPRSFRIGMTRMRWTFNGRSYQPDQVAADETVRLGTTEVWEFANDRMMAHAIHVHGLQFQVLERLGGSDHDGILAGCIDGGWEDTVLVLPGERVRVILRFTDFAGTYAYQCHMLEHAADGLMRNYRVEA